jgi:Spy/CpxP family protein refolding chaperone
MKSRYFWSLALLLVPLSPALAQRADSTDPRRADSLRHRIEQRFGSRVQEQLGLTNEQTTKLRATRQTYGTRRRELREREHRLREALSSQLQPGVAANQDSVAKLTDAMIELKLASAQAAREEMRELSQYLNPVQRARLFVMQERFHHRLKEARDHRKMGRRYKDRSWM